MLLASLPGSPLVSMSFGCSLPVNGRFELARVVAPPWCWPARREPLPILVADLVRRDLAPSICYVTGSLKTPGDCIVWDICSMLGDKVASGFLRIGLSMAYC